MATGHPKASPNSTTSAGPDRGWSVPGTGLTPARAAAVRLLILSPMISIAAGGGPTQQAPAAVTARAKAAFSAKKPYPGWTASAPLRATASSSRSTER